jgi:hypothetical protein
MFKALKLRMQSRLDERGSLPAIMGAAILISATAILLGAFAVATNRNAEVSISKTSLNAAISNCENTLDSTIQTTFWQDVVAGRSNLLNSTSSGTSTNADKSLYDLATQQCNYPTIATTVKVLSAVNYTPSGATIPDSVKVTFQATYNGVNTTTSTQVRYLKYAEQPPNQKVSSNSYIASFDDDGNAVWVNLAQ